MRHRTLPPSNESLVTGSAFGVLGVSAPHRRVGLWGLRRVTVSMLDSSATPSRSWDTELLAGSGMRTRFWNADLTMWLSAGSFFD